MLKYMKIHGFPMDLSLHTEDHVDSETHWTGFKTTVSAGDCGEVWTVFYHKDRHTRVLWADGFFSALNHCLEKKENIQLPEWIENYSGCQM